MTPASLMVRLVPGSSNESLLRLAADLAIRLKVTEVIGIAASQPLPLYGGPEAFVSQDLLDRDQAAVERELAACRDRFSAALEGAATTVEWRSTVTYGALADYVVDQARAADLLITPVDRAESSPLASRRHVSAADLVLRAGRPVLVVGDQVERLDLASVVVAWRDTREARRAAQDALPLLRLADRVTVVEIARAGDLDEARSRLEDVADWLARHGIAAAPRAVAAQGDDASQLAGLAAELDAGLLVAGAYGHARLRQWALGGVTEDLLLQPSRCTLVSH